ncbi:LysR family transcriptional regulator [Marinobacter sp. VGCF2001]|uniref:LysR family transcriptional regulator n=1 Tax=Marinobacter sp. VGCF2001 TaxID=3417189 RepID=UPI003CF61893
MINTTWLRTFCTLVDVGHFTRTAERLHMTQSGVSQHIRKLEEQLGSQLLIREGKQFRLSEAGQRLYVEAQDILLALSNLQRTIGEDPPYEGEVRIMSPGSVGLKLYPKLLALQARHPKLVIDYRFAPNQDVEQAIASSRVDIGFMTARSTLPEVQSTAIAEESLLLVLPASAPNMDWDTLMGLGFIDHPDGSHHASLLLGANYDEFQHSSLFPRAGFSNQIGMILEPVSLGLGFTVLPAHAVEAFPRTETVRAEYLENPVSETLYLCTHRQRVLQKRLETVISHLKVWLQ